ncbi:hypothetical protein [Paraburkholderia pallida]|uniref:Uncharacterized protein n=1 Tax=Paraburkholderia pallida TaxID=2547399 RepID=A0A4V1B0V2_9BURK|nr:hypothetical protein [Paraburkholderia pallida]QBR04063.1 hypothetical protein E1956_43565 [Paraburkholderia pallida]
MFEYFVKSPIDAGHEKLDAYEISSNELSAVIIKRIKNATSAEVANDAPEGDDELVVKCRLNVTGNVWYGITTKDESRQEDTKVLFNGVLVLCAAMKKAMTDENKSLVEFDEWRKMIRKSGFFIEVSKVQKRMSIKSIAVSVDTQILSQLLPGVDKSPSAMRIGKDILSALNGECRSKSNKEEAKMAHLLFVCE